GLGVCLAALTWYTVRTLQHPPRRGYAYAVARSAPGDPSELATPAPFETWTFQPPGVPGPIAVWDIRGASPDGPTVIVTHGWGESRVLSLARVPAMLGTAGRLILWDLPGHGDSPGMCRLGTQEVDALRTLIERAQGPAPLVLYGSSLGGGVSIAAAAGGAR